MTRRHRFLSLAITGNLALGCALLIAPIAVLFTALLVASSPELAVGWAIYFVWTRVWQVRWMALGVLISLALYGAATAGAMCRLVSR